MSANQGPIVMVDQTAPPQELRFNGIAEIDLPNGVYFGTFRGFTDALVIVDDTDGIAVIDASGCSAVCQRSTLLTEPDIFLDLVPVVVKRIEYVKTTQ